MANQVECLKKELFDYLREHPGSKEDSVRAAGLGEHLNKLYDGRWIGARLDFKFYQFVETAQRYLRAKATSPSYKRGLDRELSHSAYSYLATPEDRLIRAIFGRGTIWKEKEQELLNIVKSYITKNPPIYDDAYQLNFSKFFIDRRKVKLTQLLKDELKISLPTLTKKDRNVLRFRFGLTDGKPKTLKEVAQQYDTTPEKIRQIEARALRKLRH